MIGKDARSNVKYLHRAGSRSFESRRNDQVRTLDDFQHMLL